MYLLIHNWELVIQVVCVFGLNVNYCSGDQIRFEFFPNVGSGVLLVCNSAHFLRVLLGYRYLNTAFRMGMVAFMHESVEYSYCE